MVLATATDDTSSRHKCLIYDGHPSEQLPVIVPLFLHNLNENRRCLYLGDPDTVRMVGTALAAKGVDTVAELRRGALVFSSDRSHLDRGFDPRAMVDMLVGLIDDAVEDGFEGLCATGDMAWELGDEKNFDLLLEYEAMLENVFRDKPLYGICQYHRQTVPGHAIRDALMAHSSVYVDGSFSRDNLFYVPPEILLQDREARDQQGEWMCQQILRILKAERRRDEALVALRASEAEQRRLASDLAALNRDLEQRVGQRTADLVAVNKELETFSYSVSHDLRAPIRHIDGYSQILLEDFGEVLGEQGRKHLERIRVGTRTMQELIEAMLSLSRVSKTSMSREPVDLAALARAVGQSFRASEPHRDVDLVVEEHLTALGDRGLLRALMDNLIGNAWKFTSKLEHARVEVAMAGESDGQNVFVVSDNGAGFDMQYADRLFGVFQRFHQQQEFEGTGVGLATVQRIILRHGGRIWARSKPNEGAKFFFSLPKAPS